MSTQMEDDIMRAVNRKTALILYSLQGETTVVEASPAYDLLPWRPWNLRLDPA